MLLIIVPLEMLAGILVGAGIALGVPTASRRRITFAFALAGAIVGIALSWALAQGIDILLFDWNDGSRVMSSLFLQAVGVLVALAVAATRAGTARPCKPATTSSASDPLGF